MNRMTPSEFAREVGTGLLSFPVTCFNADLSFNERGYRDHIAWLGRHNVAGLFAAGGTGEFFSLSLAEVEKVIAAAVAETAGRVPVIAGAGYGTAIAKELAGAAERAGADGLLLLPTYLTEAPAEGIAAHVEAVCKSTRLGVIFYNRDRARLNEELLEGLCERCPNLVGFKDGVGDIETDDADLRTPRRPPDLHRRPPHRRDLRASLSRTGRYYLFIGHFQFPARVGHGVLRRCAAPRPQDCLCGAAPLRVLPYIAICGRRPGYAVSIVKAGMRAIGRSAGPMRPPLTELSESEFQELVALVNAVSARAEAPHQDRLRQAG